MNLSESYDGIAAEMWDQMGGDAPTADLEFYAGKILEGSGPALDLTCGSGRHLLRYLKRGLDVEGVDASEVMLATCRRKAEEQGLEPVLYRQSMQGLELPRRFQTIYISGGSFQLLGSRDDAMETLRRCYHHLESGGQMLLETFLPNEALAMDAPTVTTEAEARLKPWTGPVPRPRDGADIMAYSWVESVDRFEQIKVEKRRYEATLDGQPIESELHTLTLRWYFKHELTMMLERAGFREILIYGDYSESEATAMSSSTVFSGRRRD